MVRLRKEFLHWAIVLIVGVSLSVAAETKRYHFELIVFSHVTAEALEEQPWDLNVQLPDASASDPDNTPAVPISTNRLLDKERTDLESSGYHTLLHLAWEQEVSLGKEYAIPLFANNLAQNANFSASPNLQGNLFVRLDRYFNLSFNLMLGLPREQIENLLPHLSLPFKSFIYFPISQKRRMRSNELNYIDSPVYGILVKIIPVSAAEG